MADPVPASDTDTDNSEVARFYTELPNGDFRALDGSRVAQSAGFTIADKGKIFYVNSAGLLVPLAAGADNDVIYYASGLPVTGPVPNTWVKIGATQVVSSPVASVVWNSFPATGYSKYMIIGHNVATAVAATDEALVFHVSTDNGSTWKTTSGDYYRITNPSTFLVAVEVAGSTSTFKNGYLEISIAGLGNSTRPTSATLDGGWCGISTSNIAVQQPSFQYTRVLAETDNAIRAISVSGSNITQGTFILWGLRE